MLGRARWTELSASSGGEREEGKGEGELGCWRWTGPGRVVLGRGVGFGPECKGAGPRRKKGERAAVEVRWAELGLGCFLFPISISNPNYHTSR